MFWDTTYRALIIEYDSALISELSELLSTHEIEALFESSGNCAADRIRREEPDAVILNPTMPGLGGFSICREIRDWYSGGLLILSDAADEVDEILALELGADDYMSKPVRPRALLARLRALLRKTAPPNHKPSSQVVVGELSIDLSRRSVELAGRSIEVTTLELDLLWLLAQSVGQVLSRKNIYHQLHGVEYDGLDRSIDLCISRLRKKLGDDSSKPQRIKSVRGVGYLLAAE